MGVSSVHILPINDGLGGPQMLDNYTSQLEALGAKKLGSFAVECDNYLSSPAITTVNTQKVLNLITSTEYPASAFALIEGGPTVVTDSSFEHILTNLSNFYTPRKHVKMEVRGQRWSLNDFVVRLGSSTMGPAFKAIVAEIEYTPCCVPNNCWDIIKELGQSFVGGSISQPHPYLMSRMNEMVSPVDTIHQYNDIFTQLRKMPQHATK